VRAGADEQRGLREWREGEDEHLIHWKVSARRGKNVLRELAGEERAAVRLLLVGAVSQLADARADEPPWHEGFERAVSIAATLAQALAARHPVVRLSFLGRQAVEAPKLSGPAGLDRWLEFLAEVEPHIGQAGDLGAHAAQARANGETAIVVHAGGIPQPAGVEGLIVLDAEDRTGLFAPSRRAPLEQAAPGGRP